jgi:hypothetical protein
MSTRGWQAAVCNRGMDGRFHDRNGASSPITGCGPCVVDEWDGGSRGSRHWARLPATVRPGSDGVLAGEQRFGCVTDGGRRSGQAMTAYACRPGWAVWLVVRSNRRTGRRFGEMTGTGAGCSRLMWLGGEGRGLFAMRRLYRRLQGADLGGLSFGDHSFGHTVLDGRRQQLSLDETDIALKTRHGSARGRGVSTARARAGGRA